MTTIKGNVMWATFTAITLLMIFSIYGAFLGAEGAQAFFNSLPLAVYWILLLGLLGVGIVMFRRLLRTPGLLLIHLGCIGVIIGAMWGSEGGHRLQNKFFGVERVRSGTLVIYEGRSENRVIRKGAAIGVGMGNDGTVVIYEGHGSRAAVRDDDERLFLLPFRIKLNEFRIEYYDPPRVVVMAMDGSRFLLSPIEEGARFNLEDRTTITILQVYRNLKIRSSEEGMEAYDYEGRGSNPAVRVLVTHADGTKEEQYAFSRLLGQMGGEKKFSMVYQIEGMVQGYYSDLVVIDDGQAVLEKTIRVNAPLYYGGYHFYQSSYDAQEGRYTVLSVTSDKGLLAVGAGYCLLMSGILWHMWISRALRRQGPKSVSKGDHHGN